MAYGGWLAPFLLLCVWDDGGCRCHEMAERLMQLGFGDVKLKRLYPILQRMEKERLVASGDGHVDWPAWRRYEITASGEHHLEQWAEAFENYRTEMDHFLRLYSGWPGQQRSRV